MSETDKTGLVNQIASEAVHLLPTAYADLLKPSAQELGKGLETIAKSVNVVLSPLAVMVWGFDRIKTFIADDVSRRLKQRKTRSITTPAASVAVPTLSALAYLGSERELRALFTDLLVSAVDERTSNLVHPAFVEIIKQLSAVEARILSRLREQKYFPCICEGTYRDEDFHDAESMMTELYKEFEPLCRASGVPDGMETGQYLDNLLRLRLLEVKEVGDVEVKHGARDFLEEGLDVSLERSRYEALYVTKLGTQFLELCVCPASIEPEGQG